MPVRVGDAEAEAHPAARRPLIRVELLNARDALGQKNAPTRVEVCGEELRHVFDRRVDGAGCGGRNGRPGDRLHRVKAVVDGAQEVAGRHGRSARGRAADCGCGHAERGADMLEDVVVPRNAGELLDEQADGVVAPVRVDHLLARRAYCPGDRRDEVSQRRAVCWTGRTDVRWQARRVGQEAADRDVDSMIPTRS